MLYYLRCRLTSYNRIEKVIKPLGYLHSESLVNIKKEGHYVRNHRNWWKANSRRSRR